MNITRRYKVLKLGVKGILGDLRVRSISSVSGHGLEDDYDAVIVGGGHNGLVAAAYLAKSGIKTAVLERRHVLGGAAVTEEIVPGFKFSRASYVLSLLRPTIFKDLELKRHGLKVYLRDPSSYTPLHPSYCQPGGPTSLTLGMCAQENARQIAQFSQKDADKYEEFEEQLSKFVEAIDPLLDHAPVDVSALTSASLVEKLRTLYRLRPLAASAKLLGQEAARFYELMTAPTTKILDKWFDSEPLKATLATDSCIGAMVSPETPGSGYVLLHHVMGELEGIRGAWGYPEGGMGAVSAAIASAAMEAGANIFTEAVVSKIVTDGDGAASGVVLEDGRELRCKIVLSSATPEVTFNKLMTRDQVPEDFRRALGNIDYTSPVCKINVAVNQLPNFLADPNIEQNTPMPHHRATVHMNCEDTEMIVDAYKDALQGNFSRKPMIEMTIPSSLDPTISPPGQHVCLFFTQYAPYSLSGGRVWDSATKEEYANNVFNSVEEYAPGFKDSIVGKEILTPPDLEKIFGLTGGNIFHGSMSLDQLYLTRPTGQSVSPSSPIDKLLLCGSGAHPGGGVMGAPGRIAAIRAIALLGK